MAWPCPLHRILEDGEGVMVDSLGWNPQWVRVGCRLGTSHSMACNFQAITSKTLEEPPKKKLLECVYILQVQLCIYIYNSSTAQGGGGSLENRKPIGEVRCCESYGRANPLMD